MAITDVFKRALAGEMKLCRGRIMAMNPDGRVRVRLEAAGAPEIACELLLGAPEAAGRLRVGDEILVAQGDESGKPGVILGPIGLAGNVAATPAARQGVVAPGGSPAAPDEARVIRHREIVIEAGDELTLRCGEASIKITRDGKIVIRGQHVLSRARGTHRIKGGSVAIN